MTGFGLYAAMGCYWSNDVPNSASNTASRFNVARQNFRARHLISAIAGYNSTISLGLSSFFIKPDLKILYDPEARPYEHLRQTTDTRWGETVKEARFFDQPTAYPERRFINIIVENRGRASAVNCEVRLRLLSKTEGCQVLSPEDKTLAWDNGETKKNIGARRGKAIFHLAFSQKHLSKEQLSLIDPVQCGITKTKIKFGTWVATLKALEKPEHKDQDGLCQGDFKVHVEVVTETGYQSSKDFVITVGDSWEKLDAKMLECKCNDC